MPLTHVHTIDVRHYECDIHGFLRDAAYLRYMETAAFDATTAAGYDEERYRRMGRIWLIRETTFHLVGHLRPGDRAVITTWVMDFRRVRSRRAYTLHNAATGALVARASTDWAFLDMATGRPATIPAELIAAFFPEGAPQQPEPRERFPAAPSMPVDSAVVRRRVEWRDLDPAGHVNNAVYLDYAEEAARRFAAQRGWPTAALAATGLDMVAQQHHIEYRLPAMPDEELEITTYLSDATPYSALRHTRIARSADGELLAQVRTRWGCVDRDTRAPVPFPERLAADLALKMTTAETA